MAEARTQAGLREVLLLAGAVVAVVLGAAVLTSLMPREIQGTIFHQPVLIAVLLGGTGLVLWRIARPRPPTGPSAPAGPSTPTDPVAPTDASAPMDPTDPGGPTATQDRR